MNDSVAATPVIENHTDMVSSDSQNCNIASNDGIHTSGLTQPPTSLPAPSSTVNFITPDSHDPSDSQLPPASEGDEGSIYTAPSMINLETSGLRRSARLRNQSLTMSTGPAITA